MRWLPLSLLSLLTLTTACGLSATRVHYTRAAPQVRETRIAAENPEYRRNLDRGRDLMSQGEYLRAANRLELACSVAGDSDDDACVEAEDALAQAQDEMVTDIQASCARDLWEMRCGEVLQTVRTQLAQDSHPAHRERLKAHLESTLFPSRHAMRTGR